MKIKNNTNFKTICPICDGKMDYYSIKCRNCKKEETINNLPKCLDCNKKLKGKTTKRCLNCFIVWSKNNPHLQSNYIDGRSKRKCIDCNEHIRNRTSSIQRCWNCEVGLNNG